MNLWLIFLTGLSTGGLSCLAVQGGLLASMVANSKEKELEHPTAETKFASFDKKDWLPVMFFLGAKLVIYTVLGFLLGLLGSAITLSVTIRLAFQVFSAFFMFATAMNLLEVHPIFRFVALQPPHWLLKRVRSVSKNESFFGPVILGLFTVFIPCGVTQAMEVLAINTGSPISGALLLFAFVLGTSPIFAIVGIATAKLSEGLQKSFLKFAAFALIVISLVSLNGVLEVVDFPITYSKASREVTLFFTPPQQRSEVFTATGNESIQKITINISSSGYTPRKLRVKRGIPVELTLKSNGAYSCATQFTMRAFNIYQSLSANDTKVVTFTPTQTGNFSFSCTMGMYTGVLEVI
ncbi:MAG TPA: sulfite exporter TauE/SafE family protein [Patescibacteria group bacterium]|nr:sulfite exporter TauE/SafE family protein [Patescibacteria group bacterium]